jgi:hypothetical protein
VNRTKVIIIVLLIVLGVGASLTGAYLFLRQQNIEQVNQFASELHEGLVENCNKNGNPLREGVSQLLEKEIKTSQNTELLKQFFPQVQLATVERLIEEENEERRKILREIEPVDCATQYPEPPQAK